ncbi:MAG TPA: prepilin peptidase [Nocardioides sp.]|jgi:leader peptidase (prepilin peptidase)/N-methyltransferase|uniref:prepilin peptidase n=1 Tax=Nocardioides sp. TaxID=35761 RepID=UPI002E318577|nr:prepilin peptidase [Nocardioides sp.]HEX3932112.1 prepilin peptidase [Nocardioides sp.]
MDSTALAVLLGAVVAGPGSVLVPQIIGLVPEIVPGPQPEPSEPGSTEPEAEPKTPEDPPEPFADIAVLPGLGLRSALAGAVVGAVVGYAVGWHWAWALWVPMVPVYVALAVVDWRTRLLPTYLIRPLYVVLVVLVAGGAVGTGDHHAAVRAALGWLVAGLLYGVLWFIYPRGLGFGDVRLSGVLGIALGWVGWGPLMIGVYAGFLLGGVGGGLLSAVRVVERKGFPFGPFMLVGAVVGLLWGAGLWSGLLGH